MRVQPSTIVLARESRRLTQIQLAELIGVEQGTISKVEKGLLEPSETLLNSISRKLKYPENFFTQEPFSRVKGHYRKKITLPVNVFKPCEAIMTITERHFTLLHDAVDLPHPNIPLWDVEKDGSAELSATYVREYWRIPKGRIENLTRLLELNGIVVIAMDLFDLDGLSTFSETRQPVLFLNKRVSSDRQRFTLAHELAHFVLHWGKIIDDSRDTEKEANEFASEFLMPTRDIEYLLIKLNIDRLADLKRYWKTSMQSIVMKAKKLGLLTYNQSNYLFKQFNALGYGKGEPELFPPEQPTIFKDIIGMYINDMGYSKQELGSLLKITVEDLDSMYFDKVVPLFRITRNV